MKWQLCEVELTLGQVILMVSTQGWHNVLWSPLLNWLKAMFHGMIGLNVGEGGNVPPSETLKKQLNLFSQAVKRKKSKSDCSARDYYPRLLRHTPPLIKNLFSTIYSYGEYWSLAAVLRTGQFIGSISLCKFRGLRRLPGFYCSLDGFALFLVSRLLLR